MSGTVFLYWRRLIFNWIKPQRPQLLLAFRTVHLVEYRKTVPDIWWKLHLLIFEYFQDTQSFSIPFPKLTRD
jgi:hypothetical protein